MAAHRDWQRISGYDNPGAWVRKVAANKARNSLRNRRLEVQLRLRLMLKRGIPNGVFELPSESAEIWSAVRSLPRRQREVVVLHYVCDYSVNEIAAALNVAEGTIKAHLHQGRKALETQLGPEVESEP
jgi:RNA polymerase sigma-70 factor (ECF subfamily)